MNLGGVGVLVLEEFSFDIVLFLFKGVVAFLISFQVFFGLFEFV